jgi:hypothetical protein
MLFSAIELNHPFDRCHLSLNIGSNLWGVGFIGHGLKLQKASVQSGHHQYPM